MAFLVENSCTSANSMLGFSELFKVTHRGPDFLIFTDTAADSWMYKYTALFLRPLHTVNS